ncbi:hypothetical protein JY651_44005 [Pyxidicoccus parkwayensis]|uniref:Uncharacterized protein n=1 Tax=Pyxidicoccus parkwayensis TaxID=2813578 RepID=A0ABX7NTJ2_9BACT|nr:hypothetical protein [Pyxidicoccus parkwaysis]QSQ22038.1 hypothetical protein JY651_44005 [Pyxidicoccus parkwaysis]
MTSSPSVEQLFELVSHYFPSGRRGEDPGYDATPEIQRLNALRKQSLEEGQERWERFLTRLREALPENRVEDWSVLWSDDNCWRVRVSHPETLLTPDGGKVFRDVVGLVSILVPAAATYTSIKKKRGERYEPSTLFYEPVPEMRAYEETLLAVMRAELGVERLPNKTLLTLVPDIQWGNVFLGEVRLIDCLFTDDRW